MTNFFTNPIKVPGFRSIVKREISKMNREMKYIIYPQAVYNILCRGVGRIISEVESKHEKIYKTYKYSSDELMDQINVEYHSLELWLNEVREDKLKGDLEAYNESFTLNILLDNSRSCMDY